MTNDIRFKQKLEIDEAKMLLKINKIFRSFFLILQKATPTLTFDRIF